MKFRILSFFLLVVFLQIIHGQNELRDSLVSSFHSQLQVFPQEKVYLHTDKPCYLSGEQLWFRAHLADAATHVPATASRYVYVELINPLDTVVTRVKILHEEGAYHGHLTIPADAPEGDYIIRAYTTYMRSMGENYFFTKTIRIADPQSRVVHTETQFSFESDSRVNVTLRFSHVGSAAPLVPKYLRAGVNGGQMTNVRVDDNGLAGINFKAATGKRVILLEAEFNNNPYRKFVQALVPDDDFDVSFYPEGGSLMQGALCMVAFKAMKSNGQAANITGVLYDQTGAELQKFESQHLGMGNFPLPAVRGNTYYAVCENDKGQSKRFDLPAAIDRGYALKINRLADRIYVSTMRPAGFPKPGRSDLINDTPADSLLYILGHIRGKVYFADQWNPESHLVLRPEQFPSGVMHIILFDAGLNPLSERLLFINNQDQAQVSFQTDQKSFTRRSLVKNKVVLTGMDGEPLAGNFSVSVTSDSEITPDTTSNILTQLLLSSELRGNIENPAFYFQNTAFSTTALDLLMCTQGWRRYDIAELSQGRFSFPTFPLEIGTEISGSVKSLLLGKPVEDIEVTVMSLEGGFFDHAKTDKEGRFSLYGGDLSDSTQFIVSAIPKKGITHMELILDKETFPERRLSAIPISAEIDRYQFAKYIDKAEQKYIDEHGVRVNRLTDVIISAVRKKPSVVSAIYNTSVASVATFTAEHIDRYRPSSIDELLQRVAGYNPSTGTIRGQGSFLSGNGPLWVLDGIPMPNGLPVISMQDIAQIDVLKGAETSLYGSRGSNGVIVVYTKSGGIEKQETSAFHIQEFLPLGYQKPAEFYAPRYDTPEKRDANVSDLRTTIHWQPVVQTDSTGIASFEFYTTDEITSYTILMEGLADNGKIIRQEAKLWKVGPF